MAGTGRRKTKRMRAPGEPPRERSFPCCPLCGRRVAYAWLTRAHEHPRRWAFTMRYLGRRQSRKVRDILVGSTTPDEVARTIGPMWAETLAGWAAAVIADMASAGWDMAYLASVGRFLWVRGVLAPLAAELRATHSPRGLLTAGSVERGDHRTVVAAYATAPDLPAGRVLEHGQVSRGEHRKVTVG